MSPAQMRTPPASNRITSATTLAATVRAEDLTSERFGNPPDSFIV